MFWGNLFWTTLFWSNASSSFVTDPDFLFIEFNGQTLHNSENIVLQEIPNLDDLALVDLVSYLTANVNWEWFISAYKRRKVLTLRGHLVSDSAQSLKQLIRWIKAKLNMPNQSLKIKSQEGVTITTLATCTRFSPLRTNYTISYVPFILDFTLLDPFRLGCYLRPLHIYHSRVVLLLL